MALVVIQVQDMPDGSVKVNVMTEPHFVWPKANLTAAENLGALALDAIYTEPQNVGPKLVIAGADEMPH